MSSDLQNCLAWDKHRLVEQFFAKYLFILELLYAAPEILRFQVARSPAADIYSYGMVAIEIITLNSVYGAERQQIDIKGKCCIKTVPTLVMWCLVTCTLYKTIIRY